jgi:hypothetical protein
VKETFLAGEEVEIVSGILRGKKGIYLSSEYNSGGTLASVRIEGMLNSAVKKVYTHRLRRIGDIGDPNIIFKNRRRKNKWLK